MIDKSCGYKMASGSESDSGPPSSLCDFMLKMQDVVRLFHRLPASDACEAARALRNVADHLCLATDTAASQDRPGEALSNKGTLSASLSHETRPLPSPLLPPKEESGLTGLAAGQLDAGDSQPQWRRQRQGSDCRRRSVKGGGALRKPTSLASEPQAVATCGGGVPASPTAVAQQTSLLTSPQQTAILLSTSPANSCSHCGKNFSCAAKLVEHRRTHTGERPFVCHICNRAFSVKSNMTRHVVDTHGLKDAAVGRCGRRSRMSLGRSDSSSGTGNGGGGDDYASFPPSILPSSTQSSVNHGSDEDEQEATDLRKRPASESPLPQKIARGNVGDSDSLTTIHRFNRRKSQPRKLDSVICLHRNSMPCAGDEADDVHTDHSDTGGGFGEEDERGSGPGCHDQDRNSIVSATDMGATNKRSGMHPFDVDSQRQSAVVKPRNVSNGSGRGEELWLSCDRSFRQASPC